jgi:hypothetical protein
MIAGKMIYVDSTLARLAFYFWHKFGLKSFSDTFDKGSADLYETENEAFDATGGFKYHSHGRCNVW